MLGGFGSATLVLPVLVFFGMAAVWWRIGRDPSRPGVVPLHYEPPDGMTPAEVGTVLREKVEMAAVTATLLDLAVRGYVVIQERERRRRGLRRDPDYRLVRTSKSGAGLKIHERRLLGGIFNLEVRPGWYPGEGVIRQPMVVPSTMYLLSDVCGRFRSGLHAFRTAVYGEVARRGRWFPARPDEIRARFTLASVAIAGVALLLALFAGTADLALSVTLSGIAATLWSQHMPRKTREGSRACRHILGLRNFLQQAERTALERLGMRDLIHFERLLPYAFALGVADDWAEGFADLVSEPPAWFVRAAHGRSSPRELVSDVGRCLRVAGRDLGALPRIPPDWKDRLSDLQGF